ncbi:HET-domain-containing protein [Stipitochalara longipes BDJ]|nr:HET-domain-containing protein [Stipitochalara longipes BDJ]
MDRPAAEAQNSINMDEDSARSVAEQLPHQAQSLHNLDNAALSTSVHGNFHYTPLPQERYIRLLRIVEGDAEPLSITINAFPLDDLPDYEALSYTWGKATYDDPEHDNNDPGTSHQILIDHQPFTITENLNDGLHELRYDVKGYLWIDALCIDQTNPAERGSQVLLMGDIYSSAKSVIVWLGDPIPELDDLVKFFQISLDEWFRLWESHRDFYKSYRWFSRAWIVQEFLLAREVIIRCGEQTLDLAALSLLSQQAIGQGPQMGMNAAQFMPFCSTRLNFPFIDGIPLQEMADFMFATLQWKTPEERWCAVIIFLMLLTCPQNSSYPHDKLYSLLGMAQKIRPSTLLRAPALRVDYEQSPEDVFLSFTTLLMTKLPTLAMLSYVNRQRRYDEANANTLPSWCPNCAFLPSQFPILTVNQGVSSGLKPFAASGDLTRDDSPCRITGRTLWVSGKRVARVDKACSLLKPVFTTDLKALFLPELVQELLDTCLLLDITYPLTAQDRLEVLWRTILLDRGYLPGNAWRYLDPQEMYPAFAAFLNLQASVTLGSMQGEEQKEHYRQLLQSRERHFSTSYDGFPHLSEIVENAEHYSSGQLDLLNPLISISDKFQLRAQNSGAGHRLFVTAEKWLGSGPELLESGDEVWLLKNAALPFILRPIEDSQYELVGEAYVHGIMYGELLDAPGGREGFRDIAIV